jgi:hypothetical protein
MFLDPDPNTDPDPGQPISADLWVSGSTTPVLGIIYKLSIKVLNKFQYKTIFKLIQSGKSMRIQIQITTKEHFCTIIS